MSVLIDLTKRKFGKLVVVERAENAKRNTTQWKCRCECGKIVTVRSCHLLSGHTQSCGCLSVETAKRLNTKHGMHNTPTYNSWLSMIGRCNNPKATNYYNYGGRGITVCGKWLSFVGFFEDMGVRPKGLTIERKNNNLGYYKENCCWADCTTQCRNQRISKNNKTGIRGVWWNKARKKYLVNIRIGNNNKQLYLGRFVELEQAAKARKEAELKYWG